MPCSTFLIYLLEVVFDLTLERYPAFADRHVHFVSWKTSIPLERVDYSSSQVGVGAFSKAGQAHLDIISYCLHARNAMSGFLGSHLFQIRIDPASQGGNPVLDCDTNFIRLDT